MIINIFMAIFQTDRKAYEEFPGEINKIFPDKRKEIIIYIFIAEEQDIGLIDLFIYLFTCTPLGHLGSIGCFYCST
jgi:hypothetical protein